MKKMLMAGILAAGLTIGGAAGALAAGSYYTDMIASAAAAQKEALADQYKQRQAQMDQQLRADMITVVGSEIDAMNEESSAYLDARIAQIQQDKMNKYTNEIEAAADQKTKELKDFVDQLLKEK